MTLLYMYFENGEHKTYKGIKPNPKGYTFDNRFILHFGPTGINNSDLSPNQIQIWSSNNTIQIINNQNLIGDISIVSLFGKVVADYELTGDVKQQIDFTATSGLYIVSVVANNGVVSTKKVYIK